MTTVAYCIASHTLPDQVVRLVRTLREGSPAAPILIHHDATHTRLDRRAVEAAGNVRLVPPEAVEWGRGSQLDMLLRCFGFAVERVDFDWLVMLSGTDYPIRPLEESERDLAGADWDGYVSGDLVTPPRFRRQEAEEFGRRYFYAWRQIPEPGRLGRRAIAGLRPVLALRDFPAGVLLGRRRITTPFGPQLPCRYGPDWLTITRPVAERLCAAAHERPGLVAYYRRTLSPAESFPHTVLHAEDRFRLSGDSRRFTVWRPGSAHPEILRTADLDPIRASTADFARKFDATVDATVLDELDRTLVR